MSQKKKRHASCCCLILDKAAPVNWVGNLKCFIESYAIITCVSEDDIVRPEHLLEKCPTAQPTL